MGLVVLGECVAIVGALLEAKHAQPSCRLLLLLLLLVVLKVLLGQLGALAETVGTEGRAGASLSASASRGAGGRDDGLAISIGVSVRGGRRSGDSNGLEGGGCGCDGGGGFDDISGCCRVVERDGRVVLGSVCHGWLCRGCVVSFEDWQER
ncbi:MAG: hypothetical protein J3R72DRAFT_438908 [Linnemannia gamsii]|nr:MAG: hypothetical protein J3R72DRAFT_438908 [Linnemannia gamsii]